MNFVGAFLIPLETFLEWHSNGSQQLGLVFGMINVFSRIRLDIDTVYVITVLIYPNKHNLDA